MLQWFIRFLEFIDFCETFALLRNNPLTLFSLRIFSVAEFAQKVSLAHEQFANQVLNVVETFKKKNTELRKDR